MVADGDVGVLPAPAYAGERAREQRMGVRVGVVDAVVGGVQLLRVLVAVGAVHGVQVPAAYQRAGPQQAQERQLLRQRRQARVQAQAVGGAAAPEYVGEVPHVFGRQPLGVAHLHGRHGIGRGGREGGLGLQQCAQAFQHLGQAVEQAPGQGAQLEHQGAGARAQAFERGRHELLRGQLRVQEGGVGLARAAVLAAHEGVGHQAGRLHDEAEVPRHLGRVARVVAGREGAVEAAVDAHRAQQRVPGVDGQALLGQGLLGMRALPHQALPAGVAPRRGAQAQPGRQPGGQGVQVVAPGRGVHARAAHGRPGRRRVVLWRRRAAEQVVLQGYASSNRPPSSSRP